MLHEMSLKSNIFYDDFQETSQIIAKCMIKRFCNGNLFSCKSLDFVKKEKKIYSLNF